MSIQTDTMIVNCQIGMWQGYKLDKEMSRKVTDDASAAEDAARVNKHLIDKTALKEVTNAVSQIRNHFYSRTLPWKDNGDRLLTRKMFVPFMEKHAELRDEFNARVETFLTKLYPEALERARFRMGAMFDASDYPTAAELRRKFYVNIDIDPVSDVNDFRVKLSAQHEEVIKQHIEEAMGERVNRAMENVWERLSTAVAAFAERMAAVNDDGKPATFKQATLDNLAEIVEILPALNVLDDPRLDKIAKDVQSSLLGHTAQDLRADVTVRSAVAEEAQRIIDDMSGFMKAFGRAA